MKKAKKGTGVKNIVYNHIANNIREYIIIILIFIIGIIAGVIFVNNSSDAQKTEINTYISNFVTSLKNTENTIDKTALLKDTIKNNILLAILLWFMGCTVVGVPIVYAIIAYRGFTLSYTIASLMATLGGKGIIFSISALFIHNILFIPAIFALAVSGIRLYKSIMKDKRKENIKLEICRHTIFSILVGLVLIGAAFVEVYISTGFLQNYIKYV